MITEFLHTFLLFTGTQLIKVEENQINQEKHHPFIPLSLNPNQFKCDQCDKIYATFAEIQRHTNSAEYKNKSLAKCQLMHDKNCSFKSCTLAGLEFHIQLEHKNSQQSDNTINLTKNSTTNKNISSVKCDICQLDIASYGNSERILRIHKMNNHSKEFSSGGSSEMIKNVNKELMQESIQGISGNDR